MNSFGRIFRIQIYGESHGPAVGLILDGVPAGLSLQTEDFAVDLERRKPGKQGTTSRVESDLPELVSGIYQGRTTGAPLNIQFKNQNIRSEDYSAFQDQDRPGHADFTARIKYGGQHDPRGGGHFSGRLTLALVAAGVVAKKILPELQFAAVLTEAGGLQDIPRALELAEVDGDSIGGVVECRVEGIPAGLGEPFFDSLESVISHLAFSIPAIKGIEFGSGFQSVRMKGSEHNDAIMDSSGRTMTNHAGGINGGISNGNPLLFRLAVKPPSSTPQTQTTYSKQSGQMEPLKITGRHDLCLALRVPVVAEAIAAIAIADLALIRRTQNI